MEENVIVKTLLISRYEETVKKLKEKKENEIWVSELCQCKAKSEFRKSLWFMETDAPSLILGELVHRGLQGFLVSTFGGEVEVEVSKEFEGYLIKGRVDFLTTSEVVEIKYMRASKNELPLPHHVMQLQLYMWILNRKYGRLLYITPDGDFEIPMELKINDNTVKMYLQQWSSPKWDWECNYCAYSRFCPHKVKRRG